MIYLIRHGERADDAINNSKEEKINISTLPFDPNLTRLGRTQAEITGNYIKNLTEFTHKNSNTEFIVITSPFLRCVETAFEIAKSLNLYKNTIFFQDSLGEFFHKTWFEKNILPDLFIRKKENLENIYNNSFSEKNEIKIENSFVENKQLILQEYPENFSEYYKRFEFCFKMIRDYYLDFFVFDKKDKKIDYILVLVTHGYGIQVALENYAALQQLTNADFCCISQFCYKENGNRDKPEIPICISTNHLKKSKI